MPRRSSSPAEPFFFAGSNSGCLLLHGLTGTAEEMRYLGSRLHDSNGFSVLGVLMAGHGSGPEAFDRHGWRDWYRSAQEGLASLRNHCSRVFVVGFSMGGLIALLLALDHEQRIEGLTLLATPLFASRIKAVAAAGLWRLPGVRARIRASSGRLDPGTAPARPDLTPAQASFAQLKWISRRRAAGLRRPALVVHSRGDPSVPWQNALALAALLGPACRKTLLLRRSGHILPLDVDRDLVARETGAFFESLPAWRA
ncbi:MAG: alpha/beta fold hydrolase [bacterium]